MKTLLFFILLATLAISLFAQESTTSATPLPPLLTIGEPEAHPAPPSAPPLAEIPRIQSTPGTSPPRTGIGSTKPVSAKELLTNLAAAAATAERVRSHLRPGKVWVKRGPAGEIEIRAGLLYQGSVVAVLHFSPVDGSLLPLGLHVRIAESNIKLEQIKNRLQDLVNRLQLLPAAEFREPEVSWLFPLSLDHIIVAHLRIYFDGIHVVPDYPANQEMNYYGK